ncbi:MAG TPA: lactococcin 972 family bacteriocin [Lactobacillus sp.]|nr:lactococcin 972 family bacteriocin [Lactobacillus sp.]
MVMSIKSVIVSALAAATIGVSAVPVLAYTVDVQGGTWNYGVGSTYVWSYYSHNSRTHSAAVKGAYSASSGWISPGTEARASAQKSYFGNQSFYNVK